MRLTLSTFLSTFYFLLLSGIDARGLTQHRISHRAPSPSTDTCAYVESPLSEFFDYISGTDTSNEVGDDVLFHACLCTSEVKTFIEFSDLGIGDVGAEELELAAESYILNALGAEQCIYPPNSVPRCSRGDPCGFDCSNGFTLQSFRMRGETKRTCTCQSPNTVCGDQCGFFPDGCPSPTVSPEEAFRPSRNPAVQASPSPFARPFVSPTPSDATYSYATTPTTFENTQAQQAQEVGCAPYETLCGAYAPRGRITSECIDTRNSLESCGGCMVPPPSSFFMYDYGEYSKREGAAGVDCTALDGVADVSCSAGSCLVQACEVGWMLAPSGDHCVPNTASNAATPDEKFDDEWYAPASMPLVQAYPWTSTSSAPAAADTTTSTGATSSDNATPTGDATSTEVTSPDNEMTGDAATTGDAAAADDDDPTAATSTPPPPSDPDSESSSSASGGPSFTTANAGAGPDDGQPPDPESGAGVSPSSGSGTASAPGNDEGPSEASELNFQLEVASTDDESNGSGCRNLISATEIGICLSESNSESLSASAKVVTGPALAPATSGFGGTAGVDENIVLDSAEVPGLVTGTDTTIPVSALPAAAERTDGASETVAVTPTSTTPSLLGALTVENSISTTVGSAAGSSFSL